MLNDGYILVSYLLHERIGSNGTLYKSARVFSGKYT